MLRASLYILIGYISGSVLYASFFARLFKKGDIVSKSPDRNPGTANAFVYGGVMCGICTLVFELAKGFLPVWFFMRSQELSPAFTLPLVMVAPVLGHAFPVFHDFRGGKGIAVSFGVLLGLMPIWEPAVTLAVFFIFFSLILRVTPHFYRTLAAYLVSAVVLLPLAGLGRVWLGFAAITAVVCLKLHTSMEEREKPEIKILWMH